jgi:hypothetical protein
MIRALVVKELRESLPLVALLALAIAYAQATLTGWTFNASTRAAGVSYQTPFVTTQFIPLMPIVCGAFAALLGLKQSAWEDVRGTYHYLLHKPLARRRITAVKLATGATLAMLAGAAMILIHGLWAASPGKHGSPFYWAMTADAWRVWVTLPLWYLSAYLSGLRPALWWGTRLAPLVVGGGAAVLLSQQPYWWGAALGSAAASAALAALIHYVAGTRDY